MAHRMSERWQVPRELAFDQTQSSDSQPGLHSLGTTFKTEPASALRSRSPLVKHELGGRRATRSKLVQLSRVAGPEGGAWFPRRAGRRPFGRKACATTEVEAVVRPHGGGVIVRVARKMARPIQLSAPRAARLGPASSPPSGVSARPVRGYAAEVVIPAGLFAPAMKCCVTPAPLRRARPIVVPLMPCALPKLDQ